jgi:hypothetical protein
MNKIIFCLLSFFMINNFAIANNTFFDYEKYNYNNKSINTLIDYDDMNAEEDSKDDDYASDTNKKADGDYNDEDTSNMKMNEEKNEIDSIVNNTTKRPVMLNSSISPWFAFGLIIYKNKKCTAIQTSRYEIVTSAYCVYDSETKKPIEAKDLEFVSGYTNDGYFLFKSKIFSYLMPKMEYPPIDPAKMKDSWVMLLLDTKSIDESQFIPLNKTPMTSEYLEKNKLLLIGYDANLNLLSSNKCQISKDSIDYNDINVASSSPFILQMCIDDYKPLLGAALISVNIESNAITLVGILSAKLTKEIEKNKKIDVNLIIPASSMYLKNNQNNLVNMDN